HVPELAGRALAAELSERFGLPAFVDNDVNALALGEWMFGAGRGAGSLVVLAPGTSFGAGIVLDGRVVRGAAGFGGELGHAPVKFDGGPCWCGGRGCLALYASGRGIAEAARARVAGLSDAPLLAAAGGDSRAITAPLVFRAAREGDPVASSVVDEACRALGAMLGTVVNGLNPEVVVITGGVAESLVPLAAQILARAGEYAFGRALAATRVTIVPSDKRTSMRGAAALAIYEIERSATRASAADSVTHGLHHDAWKRRTRTFLPIRSRESNARLLPRMRTLKPGAAGAAASDETKHSRSRRAQRGGATTKAIITHA